MYYIIICSLIQCFAKQSYLFFSLFSFISYLETTIFFQRREKNEKRKEKSTKRNDNLLSKIVVSFWRRRRDLNPRAGYPTYSLSRGAPSPLGYFSMVNIIGGEREIRTPGSFESPVFKTGSLNHSDISP